MTKSKVVKVGTPETELIEATRIVEAKRRECRKWRAKLRKAEKELKVAKKVQRTIKGEMEEERSPAILPSKLTGGVTGYKLSKRELFDDQRGERAEAAQARLDDITEGM